MKRTVHHIVQTSMLLLSLLMMACDGKTDKQSYRIGVSQCSGGFWRQKQNNEMHRELLLHEGVTMELLCAEDNDEKQIADIQRLIEQKWICSSFRLTTHWLFPPLSARPTLPAYRYFYSTESSTTTNTLLSLVETIKGLGC